LSASGAPLRDGAIWFNECRRSESDVVEPELGNVLNIRGQRIASRVGGEEPEIGYPGQQLAQAMPRIERFLPIATSASRFQITARNMPSTARPASDTAPAN
jgi:hypothetical protein